MKTSVELILEEIRSLRKEVHQLRIADDDELFTVTQIRKKWKAQYEFIIKLIEQGYIIPFKLELPGDGRVKGGLRFKRSEINKVLEMFRVEVEEMEQPDLITIARNIIEKHREKD